MSTEQTLQDALRVMWASHRASVDTLLGDIRLAIDAPAPATLADGERAAHRLAGTLGTFGLAEGTEIARDLEQRLPAGTSSPEQLTALADELAAVIARFDDDAPDPPPPSRRTGRAVAVLGFAEATAAPLRTELRLRGVEVLDADESSDVQLVGPDVPDAVVIDIDRTVLAAEPGTPWPASGPPVIAVSAGRRLADRVAATRQGARRYVQRPVAIADLVGAIEAMWVSRRRTATIVAVDDDPLILDTLRVVLAEQDVCLITVDDQEQFWNAVHEHVPDVVVLDVDMPDISGIELCRVLRADDRWQQIGVIFLTAHHDASTVHAVFEAGADDMVVKPIIGPELRARLASRIERTDLHRRLAESDGLTGLANRATTQRTTERLVQAARRDQRPLSVALVDLDHFKQVNDRHGHQSGDEVLRRFAEVALRTAPSLAGRWGGEEFVLVYDGLDAEAAAAALDRLQVAFCAEVFGASGGAAFQCSFSAGVTETGPDDGLDAIVLRADEALYAAKERGRRQVVVARQDP